ncbi:MAG: hypothetical protein AAF591_21325 [Verrucomicrobiota bacterium]
MTALRQTPRLLTLLEGALLLALLSFWLWSRIDAAHPQVFPPSTPGETILLGADPYYHQRQILTTAENFPQLQRWDPGTHYPTGVYNEAAGLFQISLATVVLALDGGNPTEATTAQVLAWSPIAFGALALLAFYALVRVTLGRTAALAALTLYLLFPGTALNRTMLGFGDHHAAEMMLCPLIILGFAATLKNNRRPPISQFLHATLHALPLVLLLFTWHGGPIYILFLLVAAAIGVITTLWYRTFNPDLLASIARYFAAFTLIALAVGLLRPNLQLDAKYFLLAITTASLTTIACFILSKLTHSLSPSQQRKFAIASATLGVVLAIAVFIVPPLGNNIVFLFSPKTLYVTEHQAISPALLWQRFNILPLLAIPGIFLLLHDLRSHSKQLRCALLVLPLISALWLITRDYDYLAAFGFAALAARTLIALATGLARRLYPDKTPPLAPALITLAAATAFTLFIWPLRISPPPIVPPALVTTTLINTPAWRESMNWLKNHSPNPPVPPRTIAAPWNNTPENRFPYPPGSYGVLTNWHSGNFINTLAQRIPVSSRYPDPNLVRWLIEPNEARSLDLLASNLTPNDDVRYVVVDAQWCADHFIPALEFSGINPRQYYVAEQTHELDGEPVRIFSYGDLFRGAVGPRLYLGDASGMSHYRLIYESPQQSLIRYRLNPKTEYLILSALDLDREPDPDRLRALARPGQVWWEENNTWLCYSGAITSSIKIFETVPGATIKGIAPPDSQSVTASLNLSSLTTNRPVSYQITTIPKSDGTFSLTVPYPTDPAPRNTEVVALSGYRITAESPKPNSKTTVIHPNWEIPESAVRPGEVLRLPPPSPPAETPATSAP